MGVCESHTADSYNVDKQSQENAGKKASAALDAKIEKEKQTDMNLKKV